MADPVYVLGFDTSAAYCAVALIRDGVILEKTAEIMSKGQAERLMGLIQDVLDRNGVAYNDLSAIGVGVGPGNFTGIRIGVSAARGLALGLNVTAYGITGFDQRARCLPDAPYQCVIAPRDQMYVRDGETVSLQPRDALPAVPDDPSPADLAASVAKIAYSRWPDVAPPPSPYYLKAPDAAPAKDAPPKILT